MNLAIANPEQDRYRKAWSLPQYRTVAPGEKMVPYFLWQAKPQPGEEVIDFGCGTGRGALALARVAKLRVTMLDFAENCLDDEVDEAVKNGELDFELADLTQPVQKIAAYGFCCDVLEHIPTEDVPKVLQNILGSARKVFLNIALFDDVHGKDVDGHPLHLTVKPAAWWLEQLEKLGAQVLWQQAGEVSLMAYCTAWKDATDIIKVGKVNAGDRIAEQTRNNIAAGWQQVEPHWKQDREIVILAGGPSMRDKADEIKELKAAGAAIVTVNGAYHWALENGIDPAAQIVLDAREFNARFTKPVVDGCKYLVASQVHPATLEGLPRSHTYLWHSSMDEETGAWAKEQYGNFFPIPGGSTVVLRAILLLRMLGFWRMHFFGFDSCCADDGAHHAYTQQENDGMLRIPVICGGRVFDCEPWMLAQAYEFRDMVAMVGDEVEMAVYGDGLIAHMIATGARISMEKEH